MTTQGRTTQGRKTGMPVEFTFTIPQQFRALAVEYGEEFVKKSVYPETCAAVERVVAAMRVNRLLHAKEWVLGESHNEPSELFTDRIEVRVQIEDLPALKLVLHYCHQAPPPKGDDGEDDANWEDWSWHALHLTFPFENRSAIDFIGDLAPG